MQVRVVRVRKMPMPPVTILKYALSRVSVRSTQRKRISPIPMVEVHASAKNTPSLVVK